MTAIARTDRELLLEILERTIRVEARLGLPDDENGFLNTTIRRLDNHAERLTALERWRYYIAGAIALALTLLGLKSK